MVEPVTGHRAAGSTPEAFVVEQFRNVVPASPWLVDAARTAIDNVRVLQLVTAEHSRITYPLELLLGDVQGEWVVREDQERYRDGIRGFPMTWNGTRFAPDRDATTSTPVHPAPGAGDLEVQITTPHPAADSLRLGKSIEAAMLALTGSGPTGWGVAEPATQPWSARDVTAFCRERAPEPTGLVVVGLGVVGQLHVSTVDTGVIEEIKLSGPAAGTVRQETIEALAAEAAGAAQLMLVAAHPGRLAGLRSSAPALPALPYGILIGPEMVARNGVAHAQRTPAARVKILGSGSRNAAWCRLDGSRRAPFEQLAEILHHYGRPDQG
jgi:hypothetical protein